MLKMGFLIRLGFIDSSGSITEATDLFFKKYTCTGHFVYTFREFHGPLISLMDSIFNATIYEAQIIVCPFHYF